MTIKTVAAVAVLKRVASVFLSKKRIIGWVSAVALVAGAAAVGMETPEFKAAVCGAPVIEAE